jgi:hypothetical protein
MSPPRCAWVSRHCHSRARGNPGRSLVPPSRPPYRSVPLDSPVKPGNDIPRAFCPGYGGNTSGTGSILILRQQSGAALPKQEPPVVRASLVGVRFREHPRSKRDGVEVSARHYGVRQFIAAFPCRSARKRKQVSALQMSPDTTDMDVRRTWPRTCMSGAIKSPAFTNGSGTNAPKPRICARR